MSKIFWKVNLLNLTKRSLKKLFLLLQVEKFLYKQVLSWIYFKNIYTINDVLNISDLNKKKLSSISFFLKPVLKKYFLDSDNTIKITLQLYDFSIIECVLIPNRKNHFTLCMSSQSGCILNCSFCYTGKFKFNRNLHYYEFVTQFLFAFFVLKKFFKEKKITNIVFMGMGEPLFNISVLLDFIDVLIDKNCFNISRNKITVSSSGVIDGFKALLNRKIRLALSLHSPYDYLRSNIMLINKKYNLLDLLKNVKIFSKKNYLTIEYIMLKNINDSIACVIELIKILDGLNCKICLIPFNHFNETDFICSNKNNIIFFKNFLMKHQFMTTIRKSMGVDIYGACGQLSYGNES